MKKNKLILILSFFLFVSCNEDPISNNDEKYIKDLEEYRIAYTTLDCNLNDIDSNLCWNVGFYDLGRKKGNIHFEKAALLSPIVDNKGFILNHSENNNSIDLFNFNNLEKVADFNSQFTSDSYTPYFINNELVTIFDRYGSYSDVILSNSQGNNSLLLGSEILRYSIRYLENNKQLLYRKGNDWILSDLDGANKVKNLIDFSKYSIVDIFTESNKVLLLEFGNQKNRYFEFDLISKEQTFLFEIDFYVHVVDLSPDNSKIMILDSYTNIHMYDLVNNNLVTIYNESSNERLSPLGIGIKPFQWTKNSKYCIFIETDYGKNEGRLGAIIPDKLDYIVFDNLSNVFSAYWVE